MIHKSLKKLRETDRQIRLLELQITDIQGIRSGMPQGILFSGYGRPTESRAIRLSGLRDDLAAAKMKRAQLCRKLEREKAECGQELLWEILRDHFYHGFSWKKTAAIHRMKESAVKMRVSRILKKIEAAEHSVGQETADA